MDSIDFEGKKLLDVHILWLIFQGAGKSVSLVNLVQKSDVYFLNKHQQELDISQLGI